MRRFLLLLLLLPAACSIAPKNGRAPELEADDRASVLPREERRGARDDTLAHALDLLAKSAADSCAVCARESRAKAFRLLDERFPPGRIVKTDGECRFRIDPGGENELVLASCPDGDPRVIYRFHTAENHLAGISEPDWTEATIADRLRSASEATLFQGTLEVVRFAYGDGPTFLYRPSIRRLQVHVKILEIAPE
jgi:hypothetical protein